MRSSIPSGWTLRRTRELSEILFAADKLMLKEIGSPYLFIIYSNLFYRCGWKCA